MHDNEKAVLVCFDRRPTDDELRAIHDSLALRSEMRERIPPELYDGMAIYVGLGANSGLSPKDVRAVLDEAVRTIRARINAAPRGAAPIVTETMGWISVRDRLPTHIHSVLIWVVGGELHHDEDFCEIGIYNTRRGVWQMGAGGDDDIDVEVTHWMPLPEAPA